ncbi:zinc finger protein OZF-like [Chrysoperla carnea]|uniref:zinc finger protein OZF-like n=1 Tax=Chrysoperla carnea TaxID=189513 RepID=UPI001D06140D|nr:zinc finger protein OZF-like [Chrysoperla carnea]
MIIACASVQIWENDDLPNQICNECFLQLQNTINFKHLCENSDNAFRQIIEQNKNNLWNSQNDLDNVKREQLDSPNYPTYIKEESDGENSTNATKNIGEIIEVKNEIESELNKVHTRKKSIQFNFSEESDDESRENYSLYEDSNDSSYEDEDTKPDLEEYNCETCSKSFKKVDALGLHMKKKHDAEGVKCGKCSIICYHSLHLRAHERLHNKCSICNLTFSTRKRLSLHKLTHEKDNSPEIICELCPAKLTSKNSLYKHMRFLHKIEKTKKTFECATCQEILQTKRDLEKHVRKMHPKVRIKYKQQVTNCEVCGKSLRRRNLRKHMLTHGERDKIACEYCAKIFISQETLTNHVKTYHKNSGPVYKCLCNQCGHKFRSNYHLDKHLLTHTKARPYACDKCDKTYRTIFQLKEHVSRIHLNERNFVCTFCSQAFFDKKILLNHVRRHTGEKPYKCQMCEKAFIQKVALNVHMKTHTNAF